MQANFTPAETKSTALFEYHATSAFNCVCLDAAPNMRTFIAIFAKLSKSEYCLLVW